MPPSVKQRVRNVRGISKAMTFAIDVWGYCFQSVETLPLPKHFVQAIRVFLCAYDWVRRYMLILIDTRRGNIQEVLPILIAGLMAVFQFADFPDTMLSGQT